MTPKPEEGEKLKKAKVELKRMRNELIEISLLDIDLNFLEWERQLL